MLGARTTRLAGLALAVLFGHAAAHAQDRADDAATAVVPEAPRTPAGPVTDALEEDDTLSLYAPDRSGWGLERFATRFTVFQQDSMPGGYQSQASANRHGPGSEYAWIIQPMLYARIRQDERIHHDVFIPVDIVTAASTDALDVVSTASRDSESVNLDIFSTYEADADSRYTLHWGGHIEEPLRSATLGLAASRDLAEDNATFTVSADGIVDFLDQVWFTGYDPGMTTRFTGTVNASLSQLLSPTTIASVGYGLTGQVGLLQTPWNSVPIEGGDRVGDLFPHTRLRHAFVGRLSQAIPESRTFLNAQYRFYLDDFGIAAHTPEVVATQYLGDTVSLRLNYRFHTQTSPYFWASSLPMTYNLYLPRTADSDLAAFSAHELGGVVRWYYAAAGALTAASAYLEASYYHYERTNGLFVNVFSLGWGLSF
jgi:hypothetical protein